MLYINQLSNKEGKNPSIDSIAQEDIEWETHKWIKLLKVPSTFLSEIEISRLIKRLLLIVYIWKSNVCYEIVKTIYLHGNLR